MHGEHELDCDPGPVAGGSPPAADGFDLRIEKTPAPGLVCPDVARETSGDRRWAPLVEASFADFKEAVEDGDTARSISLVKVLAELALIERSMIAAGSRRGLRALRLARLSLARRSITRHLSQASLSPAMVADLLGVSVRHMHMLFEGTGQSFSQTVAAQRIRLSGRLLRESPGRPIAEIARACGFESLATFYRVFHATAGMPPGEFRAQRAQSDPDSPPAPDACTGGDAATSCCGAAGSHPPLRAAPERPVALPVSSACAHAAAPRRPEFPRAKRRSGCENSG